MSSDSVQASCVTGDLFKLIRVGSSSIGEAINFHEDPATNNPRTFASTIFAKISQRKLGVKEEQSSNIFADYGVKREADVLRIHERMTSIPLNEVSIPECHDPFFGTLSISKPDAVFIENESGKSFRIPIEVKTKHPSKEVPRKIPESHLSQLMFHIMCMDSINKDIGNGGKTPFGHYLHVRFSSEDTMKIASKDDILALRIMRDEKMIEEMRERLKHLYYNYVWRDRLPDDSLFSSSPMPWPRIMEMSGLYGDFNDVVHSLLE